MDNPEPRAPRRRVEIGQPMREGEHRGILDWTRSCSLRNFNKAQLENQATAAAAALHAPCLALHCPRRCPGLLVMEMGISPCIKLVEQFQAKPPKFIGRSDPRGRNPLDRGVGKGFALSRCTDEDKVTPGTIACKEMPRFGGKLPKGGRLYFGCKLSVGGREDSIDLIVLAMFDFDVIIGMDWLTKQRATVNCYRKTIQFEPVGSVGFEFVGNRGGPSIPLISSLEVTRLLDEGCQGYLATVVDTLVEEPMMQDIAVVREFSDVFPEELPGLPPEREIEFMIELAPGTEPISKAPYRMALSELKELKVQMQELLDKGFIRPSASPWGAPIPICKKEGRVVAPLYRLSTTQSSND
ncbi:hypothetical protein NL676_019779 [Syzygium grande]|nr:hypothetical protein NL676_019779 [Syzygium grande]